MAVWWKEILGALWLFLPGYVANMSPVITSKLVPKWRTPIDFGAEHPKGGRYLGNGKTWRGLILGGLFAGLTAFLQTFGQPNFVPAGLDFGFGMGHSRYAAFLFGAVIGWAALAGDAVESFAKRRKGIARGRPWFPFDQLDFIVFGLLGALMFSPILDGWAFTAYNTIWVYATLLVLTPGLHLLVNRIGYHLKLKDVPW